VKLEPRILLPVSGICLLALGVTLFGGKYSSWKTARLRDAAENSLAESKPVEASLDAAAALRLQPGNPKLMDMLADAYEATGDERLLEVLAKRIEVDPDSVDPRLRLAGAALRFGRPSLSDDAVRQMPESADGRTDYHQINVALATMGKDGNRLVDHVRKLSHIEPEKNEHLLKLAGLAILAESCGLEVDEIGRLRALSANPATEIGTASEATVLLWGLSILKDYPGDDTPAIRERFLKVIADPVTPFPLLIKALDLADALKRDSDRGLILAGLKRHARQSADSREIAVLLAWLNTKGDPEGSIAWARELGLFHGEKPSLNLSTVLADSCARTGKWNELKWLVTGTHWGRGEFLRQLYSAKCTAALPSEGTELKLESYLRQALQESEANPAHLHVLWNTARKYGWRDLAGPLSWASLERARSLSQRRNMLQSISSDALRAGDLAEFRRATDEMLNSFPDRWDLRNNGYYAALLDDGCDPDRLAEIGTFHTEFGQHPDVGTTYALALYLCDRPGDAARVLLEFEEEVRSSPSVAPFCAMVLSAIGESQRANHYRDLPSKLYFPEEKALLLARN